MEMVLGGVDDMGGDFFFKGREGTGEYGTLIRQREGSPRKLPYKEPDHQILAENIPKRCSGIY